MNKYLLAWTALLVVARTGLAQPVTPAPVLAGGDWNKWQNEKKVASASRVGPRYASVASRFSFHRTALFGFNAPLSLPKSA